jgi:hypothetical protein
LSNVPFRAFAFATRPDMAKGAHVFRHEPEFVVSYDHYAW